MGAYWRRMGMAAWRVGADAATGTGISAIRVGFAAFGSQSN